MDNYKIPCSPSVMKFSSGIVGGSGLREILCERCHVHDIAVCAALDEEMFAELSRFRTDRVVRANEMLFEEGGDKKFIYTLRDGMLRLFNALPDGRRQISVFLMPGEFVGLVDERHYIRSAEAVVESTLCCFRKDALDEMMEKYPEMRHRLLSMTRRSLQSAWKSQFLLGRMTPFEKVANFIITHGCRVRDAGFPDNPLHLAMNRTDIADYLGLTIETVSRNFSRLKTQGIIRFSGSSLVYVVDMRALRLVANRSGKMAGSGGISG